MTTERRARLEALLLDATDDDLLWARRETEKKARSEGFSRIAGAEGETALEYIGIIDAEIERRRSQPLRALVM